MENESVGIKLSEDEKWYNAGWDDATSEIAGKIGMLRQWLNERPSGALLLNEEIGFMLGVNTKEEVWEAKKRDEEMQEKIWEHISKQ